ncbi:PHP domain-containing protein [Thermodesulfobacteriota bacterium]
MIDLHTHTTASDGTLTPAQLVAHAQERGLTAIAITDHDTVEGVGEALAAGAGCGITVIPGIEISAVHRQTTLHILGYYIDWQSPDFCKSIQVLQNARTERNPAIIKKLQALGVDISLAEVAAEAGTGQVGRPHIAQVLLQKGAVRTARQAFDRFLKKGAAAYVDKFRYPAQEAVAHIRAAGGIPVLAHPSILPCKTAPKLSSLLTELAGYGIMGVEAYYTDHSAKQVKLYEQLARKHGLLVTGGSDFHGSYIQGIALGTGRGSLAVPESVCEELQQAHRRLATATGE